MAVWGVVIAVDGEDAVDGYALGIGGHEENGLLCVDIFVLGGGFAHYYIDFAAGVTSARGPPFLELVLVWVM